MAAKGLQSVIESIEKFTVDLHKKLADENKGNYVSSALSAHVVLAMVAYGAGGKTAEEMRQGLHLPEADEHAHQGFQNFIDNLNNIQKVILKIANKIYVSNSSPIKDQFKKMTSLYFRSESSNIDFSRNAEAAKEINKWCSAQTNGKITDLVKSTDLNVLTLMVLLNAVYFKGSWKSQFDESDTTKKPFYINNTSTIEVPTMYQKGKFSYKPLTEVNADVIGLPYINDDLMMVIIVPREIDGLSEIENNLEKIKLDYERDLRYKREICLSLPKFKIETTTNLIPHLSNLGMKDMFGHAADLNGMTDDPAFVAVMRQKAFIEVNEEGSEAAAVTCAVVQLRSLPPRPLVVKVDRPFLYKIVYKNITLFSGHVVDPLKN